MPSAAPDAEWYRRNAVTCNATSCPIRVCLQAKGLKVGGADDGAGAAVAISAERADTAERATHGITGPELARMMGRGAPEICEDHGMAATPNPHTFTVTAVTHHS